MLYTWLVRFIEIGFEASQTIRQKCIKELKEQIEVKRSLDYNSQCNSTLAEGLHALLPVFTVFDKVRSMSILLLKTIVDYWLCPLI